MIYFTKIIKKAEVVPLFSQIIDNLQEDKSL